VYARVLPAAAALALICGFLLSLVPRLGLLASIVIGFLIGVLVSDVLGRVSGYKQGRTMQVIAGATVLVSILSSNVFLVVRVLGVDHLTDAISSGLAPQAVASSILGILVGIYLAVRRLG
jgi:hypothetical protein